MVVFATRHNCSDLRGHLRMQINHMREKLQMQSLSIHFYVIWFETVRAWPALAEHCAILLKLVQASPLRHVLSSHYQTEPQVEKTFLSHLKFVQQMT